MLSPTERTRLVKVLRMLSSDQQGERAAAGLLATRMVLDAGADWDRLLAPAGLGHSAQSLPPPRSAASWQGQIRFLLNRSDSLTTWECGFLRSAAIRSRLTTKQLAVLDSIYRRVALWEAGA